MSWEQQRQRQLRWGITRASASTTATTVNFRSDDGYSDSELNGLGGGVLTGGLFFLFFKVI